ncbi:MAG: hypothetical protein QOG53_2286 [Frankiales bacterium]|jgi:hypothetical protein|nr:hypothetical protein [Frankiales bacterium]
MTEPASEQQAQAQPQSGAYPPVPQAPGGGVGQWGPPGKPRPIGTSILLAIVTLGIYCLVWTYKTHEEIKRHSGEGVGGLLGLILYIFVGIVTPFLIANEVEKMLHKAGRPSKVSTKTGFWILIPLIGAFIWFPKVQGQLNEYWQSIGAQG